MKQVEVEKFVGVWHSEFGQVLTIKDTWLLGPRATYVPSKGRTRRLLACHLGEDGHWKGKLMVSLSWLGFLSTMLILEAQGNLLIPELECGPESEWEDESFGCPWVGRLSEFRRRAS